MSIAQYYSQVIGAFLNESLTDMIRVETMEDHQTIVMTDGTLMSMIALEGSLRNPDENDLIENIEKLRIDISNYMSQPGHMIEFSFVRDPNSAKHKLKKIIDKTERASSSLGLDIKDVLDERRNVFSNSMIAETILICIYTRPSVLSKEEGKEEGERAAKERSKLPVMVRSQYPSQAMDLVYIRHSAMVDAINTSLKNIGQLAHILDVTSALREIRSGLHPETAPYKEEWSPRLPEWGKDNKSFKAFINMPETEMEFANRDYSYFFQPKFNRQIAIHDAEIENSRTVRIGDLIFSSFDMTLPPETLPDFNNLVKDITAKSTDIPWRSSLRIEAGGIHSQSLKAFFLAIFSFASPTHNNRIRMAINALKEIDGQDDTVVKFRMSFATWSPISKPDNLRRNAQILIGAVQRWGNCRADGISGDQLVTLLSTVPGANTSSTAPVAAAPLQHALALTPLARQASPWKDGAVIYRTDDGKPWPYQPGSSRQTTWVTLLVGTPGSGKSVTMNAINFASAISPSSAGGSDPVLPRLAMIDIGPSSSGMISLIQEALPAERRHEVIFKKLKQSVDNTINVFDTQLGMRIPTSSERQFLINFLSLICGSGDKAPSSAMRGLITASIDQVYIDASDINNPRRYMPNEEKIVDDALNKLGFVKEHLTSWWEIVDLLMENNLIHEASVAQRHAVPVISDLARSCQAEQISALYADSKDLETGQSMIASFQRLISETVRDYPILSEHTKFSLGSARIVALDLMEVTAAGAGIAAKKQTAIMYMLARQILTRDFFIDESEFRAAATNEKKSLPEIYLDYHVKRARENLQLPKLICMDEFHRTGKIEMIIEQVMQDAREGRKFNIDIKIASQLIEDFPSSIIEVATSLIVCNVGSENSINYMDEQFDLTEGEKRTMRNQLTGPTSKGAPLWAMFKLKEEGDVRQKLNLTLGPAELWAFSTTAEDVVLRGRLYDILGPRLTRKILARRFPGGSAKAEIESRIARMEEIGNRLTDEQRGDVIGDLVNDLKSAAYLIEDKK